MKSILLAQLTRLIMPVLLLFSLFLLLRGHDLPGGGFIGGLVAASAFILLGLSESPRVVRVALKVDPLALVGAGLIVALSSALFGVLMGGEFFKGYWTEIATAAGPVKLGTPVLFDVGVYLVVTGIVVQFYLSLGEE